MKKRVLMFCLSLSVLICAACTPTENLESKGGYQLYFTVSEFWAHGSAIQTQAWPGTGTPTPKALLQALLSGPKQEGLTSPFPRGVTVVECAMDPERPGHLQVVLSEQYSGLSDVSLTLADYCIVMTLTQLPHVKSVEIQTQGGSFGYRSHQILRPEEVELPTLLP